MELDIQKYIDIAREEILNPSFGTTQQYLEVHDLELENGLPKVARVNSYFYDGLVAVYFQIKDEDFFLEVHLTKEPEIKVYGVWTESGHRVYLSVTSEKLTFKELSKIASIKGIEGYSKGDSIKLREIKHKYSCIMYEPIKNLAYSLEEKLELLLNELEKKTEEVINLSKKADAQITVCKYQYISGNKGIGFDVKMINRLSKLNLGVDIDTYIIGNEIK